MFIKENDLEEIKRKLRNYTEKDIEFNDPHFTRALLLREGDVEEVKKNLLNPDRLAYSYQERGKYGDIIHCLHFKISNRRTMKIPVIFDRKNKKSLYIITYIMRYRPWQSMIKKKSHR